MPVAAVWMFGPMSPNSSAMRMTRFALVPMSLPTLSLDGDLSDVTMWMPSGWAMSLPSS